MTDKIYAELPEPYSNIYPMNDDGFHGVCYTPKFQPGHGLPNHQPVFTSDHMRAFADATHALRTKALATPADQQAAPAVGDDLRDRLVAISAAIADQDDRGAQAMLREILAAPQQEVPAVPPIEYSRFLTDVLTAAGLVAHGKQCKAIGERLGGMVMRLRAAPQQEVQKPVKLYPGCSRWGFKGDTAQPAPKQEVQERIPDAWTNLLAYVLQGDMHNRLTPRVVDIAYSAFMLAKQPNTEDGGASDWFNDTKPAVTEMIEKLRKDLIEDFAAQPAPSWDAEDAARWRMAVLIGNEVMLHPDKRTNAAAVKAYMDATGAGADLTGAVDAAINAARKEGKP